MSAALLRVKRYGTYWSGAVTSSMESRHSRRTTSSAADSRCRTSPKTVTGYSSSKPSHNNRKEAAPTMTQTTQPARRVLDEFTMAGDALANPEAREVLRAEAPGLLESPQAEQFHAFPLGGFLRLVLSADRERASRVLAALAQIENTAPPRNEPPEIEPDRDYEAPSVPRASARLEVARPGEVYRMSELTLVGPAHGNPFIDVELTAEFRLGDRRLTVGGFYDGDGRYSIRFLPPEPGRWSFTTESTARSLDGVAGTLEVFPGDARGPVRVADTFHFAAPDGTPYRSVGTTAYAWTHQPEELQERTLRTLADAPFNKLRMCLFPKHFLYNENEPDRFVFPRNADGTFDLERFDVRYFATIERRIAQLGDLGIEAEVILFHPYDRWGFADLGKAADERYVRYVVRRFSAFPTVWWSMANEYDLITAKRPEDWNRLGSLVRKEDHAGHPLSIHNWMQVFDQGQSWVTHASIQRGGDDLAGKVDEWRLRWNKPVVIDEFGYEGDLDQGWGNRTAEEVVRRFWEVTLRGGYLTHGETFWSEDEVIFWSKGGELRGESLPRIAFLEQIVAESSTGRIDPIRTDWDAVSGGVEARYLLLYFGAGRPRFRNVAVPPRTRARIDVLDTWNMTIDELPGLYEGTVRIDLPARPYMAIRLRTEVADRSAV
jgi:hypothetical protein